MWHLLTYVLAVLVIILFVKVSNIKARLLALEKQSATRKKPTPAAQTAAAQSAPIKQATAAIKPALVANNMRRDSKPPLNFAHAETDYLSKIVKYFSSGNVIAKLGVVILFFGVVFLLKYATDHNMLPLSLRLISTAALAVVLLIIGWVLQPKKSEYGLILQGCGIGILYITCFISYRLYHLLPPDITFVLLLLIGILAAVIALLQNSMTLILLAQVGGFAAPLLAAGPHGSELGFFSYYAMLNISIAIIAWFKAWRILNVTGFAFTFVLAGLWGFWQYQPQHYALTQSFLIFFTVLYTIITVLFSRQQQRINAQYLLDNVLLFGVPLISFGLQMSITLNQHLNLALSALAYGAFYTATAFLLLSINKKLYKLLAQTYLYITCVFILMTILLGTSHQWVGVFMALATLPLLITGLRTEQLISRVFAEVVLGVTIIVCFLCFSAVLIFEKNMIYMINGVLIGLIGMLASGMIIKNNPCHTIEKTVVAPLLFIAGALSWLVFSLYFFYAYNCALYGLLYFSLLTWAWYYFASKFEWIYLQLLTLLLFPLTLCYFLKYTLDFHYIPWTTAFIWAVAFASQYGLLRFAGKFKPLKDSLSWLHAGTYWLVILTVSSLAAQIFHFNLHLGTAWQSAISGLIPLLAVAAIMLGTKKSVWPFKAFPAMYLQTVCAVILVAMYFWSLFANVFLWNFSQNLLYIPLLNPVDLLMAFTLNTIVYWFMSQRAWLIDDLKLQPVAIISLLLAWGFIWISAMTIRSVHYWAHVPYQFDAILASTIAQTSLTIVWCLLSLIIVALATWRHSKAIWWVGMMILAITIGKLFFVDLANSNSIARIISFIGVGLVLLLIGYFSPVFGSVKNSNNKK